MQRRQRLAHDCSKAGYRNNWKKHLGRIFPFSSSKRVLIGERAHWNRGGNFINDTLWSGAYWGTHWREGTKKNY